MHFDVVKCIVIFFFCMHVFFRICCTKLSIYCCYLNRWNLSIVCQYICSPMCLLVQKERETRWTERKIGISNVNISAVDEAAVFLCLCAAIGRCRLATGYMSPSRAPAPASARPGYGALRILRHALMPMYSWSRCTAAAVYCLPQLWLETLPGPAVTRRCSSCVLVSRVGAHQPVQACSGTDVKSVIMELC